jgi:drug/metabolite transporter (DMT)-like permease
VNDRRGLTLGVVLVALGGFFLLREHVRWSGPGPILISIGVVLVTLSALRGFRGPLLPGSILLGLGAAFLLEGVLEAWLPHWATLVLGIGCGLLLTAALDRAAGRDRHAARLLPGSVLVALAAGAALARQVDLGQFFERFASLWPWLLIAAGLGLVATALRSRKTV